MSGDMRDDVARSPMMMSAGSMVQHYRIIEKLGAGGMG